jgi:hypothetical protein
VNPGVQPPSTKKLEVPKESVPVPSDDDLLKEILGGRGYACFLPSYGTKNGTVLLNPTGHVLYGVEVEITGPVDYGGDLNSLFSAPIKTIIIGDVSPKTFKQLDLVMPPLGVEETYYSIKISFRNGGCVEKLFLGRAGAILDYEVYQQGKLINKNGKESGDLQPHPVPSRQF